MPRDQTQAIEFGEQLEAEHFIFSAIDAAEPLKRAPNAFLKNVLSRLKKGRITVEDAGRLSGRPIRPISPVPRPPSSCTTGARAVAVWKGDRVSPMILYGRRSGRHPTWPLFSGIAPR